MNDLLRDTARRAVAYLDTLTERDVAPSREAVAALSALRTPLPEHGCDAHEVVARLDRLGSPASVAMAGPRFFGFVTGGSTPAGLAANWLAGAWDQNTSMHEVTPGTAALEAQSLAWLLDLLGLPADCAGSFVTGATVANFTALAAARNAVLGKAGWQVEADGLFGAPPFDVILGEETHPSVLKALGMLGLGRRRVHRVPCDAQGRLRTDLLPCPQAPAIFITQIGNVNTGASDDVAAVCDVAHEQGGWVHVDGAFGLWAAASPTLRGLVVGAERADSWATDAHKWLNVPYDSGLAFVRDEHALRAAMSIVADYLPMDTAGRNPAEYTPELSRRARGVEIWAALSELGRRGVAELIERCCAHARRFAAELSAAGYEILNDVALNQVLVSFGSDRRTREVIREIQRDGTCWCGVTVWHGRTAMRISVSNWSTTADDVARSVAAMIRIARSV